jgi:hypothetical protein
MDSFINDAIRDISMHFPRLLVSEIDCEEDVRIYDLDSGFISAISVEYPTGEDPPEYLRRRPCTHPRFWIDAGYYDIVKTSTADSDYPPQLYISEEPGAGETITITYNGEHNALSGGSDVTTILDRHLPLISLFVRWRCWAELATTEGANPDPIKLLSATQEVNAYRAERAYRKALEEAKAAESESRAQPWGMDGFDRVY